MLLTVVIVLIYLFSLNFGYMFSRLNQRALNIGNDSTGFEFNNKIYFFLQISCWATIAVSIVNVLSSYPSFEAIKVYILNPGDAYEFVKHNTRYDAVDGIIRLPSSIGVFLNILSFSKYVVLTFGTLYWGKIKAKTRVLIVSSIVIYAIHAFLIGAMINIGVMLFCIAPVILYFKKNKQKNLNNKKSNKIKTLSLIFSCIVLLTIIFYFRGARELKVGSSNFFATIKVGFSGILVYISHGYVGLSTCFDLAFTPTFGLISFRGLTQKFLPNEFYFAWEKSYLYKNQLQTNWQALQVWSTIFPWIASDFSFWLIPIFMFLMGYWMGKVWIATCKNKNPFALLLMTQFMIFGFMIPANNQLFHTFGNSIATIIIAGAYMFTKKEYRSV